MAILEFLKDYIGEAIALFLGGLINFIFNKRKEKATVTTTEIENGSNVVKMYKDALDDLPPRYEKKFNDLNELFDQKERILKEEIDFLKKERDLWKKKFNDLRREYIKYKQEHP
ncbi:hypothetical protein FIA58_013790 [Flavobacterium jejuense]|uniref:Uncharacterized protein n=1 Tax=Flavobacterium jejuense TaxID=1544455 RepID=A0ABX0IS98_9FLAO|nr:hypothetical protein [Flavobacterium jejuense]NHN26752.1 hypothetical protein [Flavobacterium jejuense]